jgi:hypothetical protein
MEKSNHLLNNRGQIMVEALFIALMVGSLLIVFSKLIDFQKSKKNYSFNRKDYTYAQ